MSSSRLQRPHVSEVSRWIEDEEERNQVAKLYFADIDDAFWKVVAEGKKPKYFYGETAWQDARRYAYDMLSIAHNPHW